MLMPVNFDREGHRGCRGLMPENTWPAMKTAIDLGVTTLEMDVVISADRQVVVSHEAYFSSEITTKPDGNFVTAEEEQRLNIYHMDYAEVMKYDVGLKLHPCFPGQQKIKAVKPTLPEIIQHAEAYAKKNAGRSLYYNIEIKSFPEGDEIFHPKPELFVSLVMEVVKNGGVEPRVILQSFDFRPLRILNKKYPHIKTAMLVEELNERSLDDLLNELGYKPERYSPYYPLVDKKLVEECHQKGMRIIPWTVNNKLKMQELIDIGVDGIITDYPDLFI